MKLIVAKKIGFCTGVKRALSIAKKSLEEDPKPVHFLGAIIHNEKVLAEIKEKGGIIISNPKDAKSGTLVIRAHGSSTFPKINNVLIEDATCFLVKKAQIAAQNLYKERRKIIIIGNKEHPEVRGILGHVSNKAEIIKNEEEAEKIKSSQKLGVIAQTTQNIDLVNKINGILKKKTKDFKWINTLCPQVAFRQKELKDIMKKAKAILIIGSRSSANTNQLIKTVQKTKKPYFLANSLRDLNKNELKNIPILGMVSGTSAPDWIIEEIRQYLIND